MQHIGATIAIVLIIALFISAVIIAIMIRKEYIKELANLNLLLRKFARFTPPYDRENIYKTIDNVLDNGSVVHDRVSLLYSLLNNRNISISLSEISELSISKKDSEFKSQFLNFSISVLLIIGLAGTFWAFRDVLSNSGISEAINSSDKTEYIKSISAIYNGFQHAFLASLSGIIGTVVLLALKFLFINPIREFFVYKLDWFTQTELIPCFTKPDDQETLIATIENFRDTFSDRMKDFDTSANIIKTASTEMKETVDGFSEKIGKTVDDFSKNVNGLTEFSTQLSINFENFKKLTDENSFFYIASTRLFQAIKDAEEKYNTLGDNIA